MARRDDSGGFCPLVARALEGDAVAWEALVERLRRVVWKAVSGFGLDGSERDDAFAMTFLRLYERLGTVHEPEKLPGWIAQVARNEVYAILRARRRFRATIDTMTETTPTVTLDEIDDEAPLRAALREAFAELREKDQELLRLLMSDPPTSYAEISERLHMPMGAIGPTRGRILERLRGSPALARYVASVTS